MGVRALLLSLLALLSLGALAACDASHGRDYEDPESSDAVTSPTPGDSFSDEDTGPSDASTTAGTGAGLRGGPAVTLSPTSAVQRDVTYCSAGGVDLKMDIYLPPGDTEGQVRPAAIYVHGGGWTGGARDVSAWLEAVGDGLLEHGLVVASADYRLAPATAWPAQIVDVKCAVRYLRANASAYGIDPARIGAWGTSAGGHLVSLLATAGPAAGWDTGDWPLQSSGVQAVVDFFGPEDLASADWANGAHAAVADVFGTDPAVLAKASPVSYVTGKAPPFLIIHGDADRVVPVTQGQELAAKLQAVGAEVTLVTVQGGAHGLLTAGESPPRAALAAQAVTFIVDHLR